MIVVAGEALADLVSAPGGATYAAHPGGGPANVAVALGRLGSPVAMLARLADDRLGQLSRARLAEAGVDLRWAVAAAEPSTLALVDVGRDGGAAYTFYDRGTADFAWRAEELPDLPDDVAALHTGSLALLLPPGGAVLRSLLQREHRRRVVSVDPNVRPGLADAATYRAAIAEWLPYADLVKVSVEDLAHVAPGREPVEVAGEWLAAGPAVVVLTAGEHGATVVTPDGRTHRPAVPADVVDTVGAGDAFTAGLLDALDRRGLLSPERLRNAPAVALGPAVDYAARVAALTCGRPGADPPWAHELRGE